MERNPVMKRRIAHQRALGNPLPAPEGVVRHLTAIQAQDYRGGLWAVGLRTAGAVESMVEEALADRTIVRTWPMRGTLHLVAAEDVWWMLELLAPHVIRGLAGRHRQLGLGHDVFARARGLFENALQGGAQTTREEAFALLERNGVSPAGQRGIHIIGMLAQQGVLCYGPRKGKQHTFVLLEEWVPRGGKTPRDEALAGLARRYFSGHGPATARDFSWWAGLTARDAQRGLDGAASALESEEIDGKRFWSARDKSAPGRAASSGEASSETATALLLPPFDELLVGYADRSAALDPAHAGMLKSLLSPTILVRGRVVGIWNKTMAGDGVRIAARFFSPPREGVLRSVRSACRRYGDYLGVSTALVETGKR